MFQGTYHYTAGAICSAADCGGANNTETDNNSGKFLQFTDDGTNLATLEQYSLTAIGQPGRASWYVFDNSSPNTPPNQPYFMFNVQFSASYYKDVGTQNGFESAYVSVEHQSDAAEWTITYPKSGGNQIGFFPNSDSYNQLTYIYSLVYMPASVGSAGMEQRCGPTSLDSSVSVAPWIWCGSAGASLAAASQANSLIIQRAPVTCGDQRDTIVSEYSNPSYVSLNQIPICTDFTNTAHTADYTYASLRDSTVNFSLLRLALMVPAFYGYGLDLWSNAVVDEAPAPFNFFHNLNSGYRSPAHNASKAVGGKPNSQHMWGNAADLQLKFKTVDELNALNSIAETVAGADYVELYSTLCPHGPPCVPTHAHADWRFHAGLYTPLTETASN